MDAKTLHRLVSPGGVDLARCQALLPGLQETFKLCNLNSIRRRAMFFSQILCESGGLKWTTELADGSEYNGRRDLGNTQPGDGPRFKGRGFIQLTGRNNYGAFSRWCHKRNLVPGDQYFINNPQKVANDKFAWISAGFYWMGNHDHGYSSLNAAADAKDLIQATYMVNGGQNGIDTRRFYYQKALGMGKALM